LADGSELVVKRERHQLHDHVGDGRRLGPKLFTQGNKIGQAAGFQCGLDRSAKFSLAGALMRKGEQLDHDTARAPLALFGQQRLKDQGPLSPTVVGFNEWALKHYVNAQGWKRTRSKDADGWEHDGQIIRELKTPTALTDMHGRNCKLIVAKPKRRGGYMPTNFWPARRQRSPAPRWADRGADRAVGERERA
jgi:hypothetical protein